MFKHDVLVLDPAGNEVATIGCWVDTASSYTWLPDEIRVALGVQPSEEREFVLADGRRERRPVAQVRIALNGRPFYTYCAFAREGEEYLLGAIALEEAGLAADMVRQRLIPSTSYALTRIDA